MKKLSFILAALMSVAAFSANADVETAQILANKYAVIAKKHQSSFNWLIC